MIRLAVENDLHLRLDRHIDAQFVRHEMQRNMTELDSGQVEKLEELLEDIADHGVFGTALHALRERLHADHAAALETVVGQVPDKSDDLLGFIHDRLKVYLRDEGIRHDVIDACLAMEANDDIALLVKRARALQAELNTEDGENLVQGFRRANNILSQAEEKDGVEYSFGANRKLAETDEERALFDALAAADERIRPAMAAEDFPAAMAAMAALRPQVDAFFEAVQVNTDNEIVRRNRLNLLSQIRTVCLQVADLTKLEG